MSLDLMLMMPPGFGFDGGSVPEPSLTLVVSSLFQLEGDGLSLTSNFVVVSYAGGDDLDIQILLDGVSLTIDYGSVGAINHNFEIGNYQIAPGAISNGPHTLTFRTRRRGQVAWADTKTVSDYFIPASPFGLTITPNADDPLHSLDASWTNLSSDYDFIDIGYGDTVNATYVVVASYAAGTTSAEAFVSGITLGGTKYVSIRARKGASGAPDNTDWITATGTTAQPVAITYNGGDAVTIDDFLEGNQSILAPGDLTYTDPNGGASLSLSGADAATFSFYGGDGVAFNAQAVPGIYNNTIVVTDNTYPAVTDSIDFTITVKPLAPTGFVADSGGSSNSIGLTWTDATGLATSVVRIYRRLTLVGGSYSLITTADFGDQGYTDNDAALLPLTSYDYRISAYDPNSGLESAFAEATASTGEP